MFPSLQLRIPQLSTHDERKDTAREIPRKRSASRPQPLTANGIMRGRGCFVNSPNSLDRATRPSNPKNF